ncbi:MAG: hypothetical protein R2705_00380 [Ilumatobacteraceae bacterium]
MKKDVLVFEEPGDLRRLVIAVVVTIAALPFLWSGHSDAPDSVATIGATVSDGMELSGMEASSEELASSTYLVDPLAPSTAITRPNVVTIDVSQPCRRTPSPGWPTTNAGPRRPRPTTRAAPPSLRSGLGSW